MGDFNTYWRMTINNYDARDLALVSQGYPDDIRKLVYTLEEGESGTPHIQAYIQMKRSVRLSHMRKLFPGANFGTSTSAEWRLNQERYAQKDDATTRSAHVIQNNDPLHTIEGTVRRVVEQMISDYNDEESIERARLLVEREMVVKDYTMAKVFVSSTYKTMWRNFGHEMYQCLFTRHMANVEEEARVTVPVLNQADTHTHTHAERIFPRGGGITDAEDDEGIDEEELRSEESEDDEGDEDSESEASEGYDQGWCSRSSSSLSSEEG